MATNSSQFTSPASLKRSTAVETLASAGKALGKSKVSAFWKPWHILAPCDLNSPAPQSCLQLLGNHHLNNDQRELARTISNSYRLCLRTLVYACNHVAVKISGTLEPPFYSMVKRCHFLYRIAMAIKKRELTSYAPTIPWTNEIA